VSEEDVFNHPEILEYIKNPSERQIQVAVGRLGHVIRFIDNPSEEACILAVKSDPYALRHIVNQTETVCKLVVSKYGSLLSLVKDKTPEICEIAVSQSPQAIRFVPSPLQSEELCKEAIREDFSVIAFLDNPSEELKKLAISKHISALAFIKDISRDLYDYAFQQDFRAIFSMPNPTESQELVALKHDWTCLSCIKSPNIHQCTLAWETYLRHNFTYLFYPSEEKGLNPDRIKKDIKKLAKDYAKRLNKRVDERIDEMNTDDKSHYLIYRVLNISPDEGEKIDVYQNKGRFLYRYAGSSSSKCGLAKSRPENFTSK